MNTAQANEVLRTITATWPQKDMTAAQVDAWVDTLTKITSIDAARATVAALKESSLYMPSHAEFFKAARHEAVRLAEQRALHAGDPLPCPECRGDETVEVGHASASHTIIVRPCSRCRPVQYVLWSKGHYASGHSCGLCHDLRHGTATQQQNAREELLAVHVPVDLADAF